MTVILGLVGLALFVVCFLIGVVWFATDSYVVWRVHQRETLRETNPPAYKWLGPYRSPFPWHEDEDEQAGKGAA